MSYDAWKTTEPDPNACDDPEDRLVPEYCPDCGAGWADPCAPTCGCAACRRKEALMPDLSKDAA